MNGYKNLFFTCIFLIMISKVSFATSERYVGIGSSFGVTNFDVNGTSTEDYWENPKNVIDPYKYKPGVELNFMNVWDNGYVAGAVFDYNYYKDIKETIVSEFGAKNLYNFRSNRLAVTANFGYLYDYDYFFSIYGLLGIQYANYNNNLSSSSYSPSGSPISGALKNSYNTGRVGPVISGGLLYRLNDLLTTSLSFKYYYMGKTSVIKTENTDYYIQNNGVDLMLLVFITF